jgi:hypothetical protein
VIPGPSSITVITSLRPRTRPSMKISPGGSASRQACRTASPAAVATASITCSWRRGGIACAATSVAIT